MRLSRLPAHGVPAGRTCASATLSFAALCVAAAPAAAHAPGPAPRLGWTFDPWVTVPLALAAALFVAGYLRLGRRSAQPFPQRGKAAAFAVGWLLLAGALVTPLHAAGERSFAAHMLEHELMMLAAAPLLVLSRPASIWLWAFPARWRQALGRSARSLSMPWRWLAAPLAATALQAAALWLWHAPAAFDLALASPGWHVMQHLCFLASALLFWWAMLHAPRRKTGTVVSCLFFTSVVSGALGALMAFSQGPWYAGYTSLALDAFGLSPAEDQQLAGLLMWVPGGLVHAAAGIALLARGLADDAPPRTGVLAVAVLLPSLAVGRAASAETVYVSDEQADVVHVVRAPDWAKSEPIVVGARPRGMQLRDGRLYVAASDDNRIDVLDLASRKVVTQLPSGPDPERFALAPDGRMLYVANEDDAKVSFLDMRSKRVVAEVDVGAEPEGIAASPDGRWVICTSETASLVHFIDARTHALVDNVPVGTRPRDAVFSRDGRWLWVSSEMRATVAVFDMRTRALVRTIDFDRDDAAPPTVQAVGIALTRGYDRAFVALGRGNQVAEVEPRSGRIVRYFPVGQRNWSIALSPDEKRLYAANGLSGDVTVIDLVSNRPLATIRTGGKPWGVEVGP